MYYTKADHEVDEACKRVNRAVKSGYADPAFRHDLLTQALQPERCTERIKVNQALRVAQQVPTNDEDSLTLIL